MAVDSVLLYENPFGNPRRGHRRGRRNPVAGALALPKNLMQGIDVADVAVGAVGLGVAAWLPAQIIKPKLGEPLSTTQKWLRVLVAGGGVLAAGFVASKIGGSKMAKAVVLGGLAGTAITAVNTVGNAPLIPAIGGTREIVRVSGGGGVRGDNKVGTQTPGFEGVKIY